MTERLTTRLIHHPYKPPEGFEAFPPGCRREYAEWIGDAKRDETRAKRIATTMANLREGKKLHWKYERC